MNKDWKGNQKSTFSTLGASNHSNHEREKNDYYATNPKAIDDLFKYETFTYKIWEPACGEGHLSIKIAEYNDNVYSSDLIDRGFGDGGIDFLKFTSRWDGDIITNPPYKYAKEFVEQALKLTYKGNKIAMFLKLQFLEGQERYKLFKERPPKVIYVYSKRISCAINGNFTNDNGAVAYAWYVWENGYKGDTIIKWIEP